MALCLNCLFAGRICLSVLDPALESSEVEGFTRDFFSQRPILKTDNVGICVPSSPQNTGLDDSMYKGNLTQSGSASDTVTLQL